MKFNVRVLMAAGVLGVMVAAMPGCGEATAPSGARDEAGRIRQTIYRQAEGSWERNRVEQARSAHSQTADALDGLLERYADADEDLRSTLEELRDGQRALGNGDVSGSEAEDLRQEQEQLWDEVTQEKE